MCVLQVAELIAGLEHLGCASTTGEGQTLCVMSNSFNVNGNAAGLQDLGDLPEVDVVKVRLTRVFFSNVSICTAFFTARSLRYKQIMKAKFRPPYCSRRQGR